MTTITKINQFPATRQEVRHYFEDAKASILNGDIEPLRFAVQIKAFEELVKNLREDKDIRSLIIEEVAKSGKEANYSGSVIRVSETGVKYDYSGCGSSKWEELDAEIKRLTEQKKELEKFLQVLPEGGAADPETGEILCRPIRTSTTSPVITLK
jgi:hypothetical protein